ncbi:molybdopterin-containing oxidoreductase family protein [Nocardia carnea]|uniref:molybdopterin-containing oxidoreductase family protein n=1 Tax=Nocardia carnea TaxID=37328 RepID=UPI0024572750|nr:molybdopterin-dependent oxidoreductase [Nocardia carnea]
MTRTTVPSYCRICEACCGILADVEDGRVVAIHGDPEHPSSQGLMCPKGSLMVEVTNDPERVTTPLRGDRKGGFVPVSWDEALDDIADRVKALITEHGPDSVAYYSGNPAGSSMAGHMWSKKFIDGIGSKGSYSAAPQDTSSRWAASHFLYGNTHEVPLPDLDHTDFFLCFGANPLVSHGSLMSSGRTRSQLANIAARGGRVVVVDPARTQTAQAYEHLSVVPSSDPLLMAAMLQVIFAENLVSPRAEGAAIGIGTLSAAVEPVTPESVQERTGVDADTVRALARDFATAQSACAYGRLGICRGAYPTLANYLLDALNVVTGNLDRRGGVVFGSGLVDFPAINAKVGRTSYSSIGTRIGGLPMVGGRKPWVLAEEILTPGEGQIRGVFLASGNPVSSTPDAARLEAAFEQLELLVAVDIYITESNEHADYILPAPTFLERADVLLNFGGGMTRPWVQWTEPVVPRIGDTREETEIFGELMRRMGVPPGPGPWELIDTMVRTGARGSAEGWTLERIKQHPHGVELGGDVPVGVIAQRIATYTNGAREKVDLGSEPVLAQLSQFLSEEPPEPGTLLLISRRHLRSINSWMHNVRKLRPGGGPTLYLNPVDARDLGIETGATVTLTTSVGSADVVATVTDEVRPGTVSYPHGWGHSGGWSTAVQHGGININKLIPNDIEKKDPLSGMSLLDGVRVRVSAQRSVAQG